LSLTVELPQRLGGGTREVHKASHAAAQKHYKLGAKLSAKSTARSGTVPPTTTTPPPTVDLTANAPEPGDQGETGSCATWATGYSVMGWWASKAKLPDAPYAPMFLYSQLVDGSCNDGTAIGDSLSILNQQGIASATHYEPMQDNLDCTLYSAKKSTTTDAARHRITGSHSLPLEDPVNEIKAALAGGTPVVLGIMVYDNVENADADSYFIDAPSDEDQALGGHAIAAFGYDQQGLWILNSWTTKWGNKGWGELSWDFVSGQSGGTPNVIEADVIEGVVPAN
jgi:hypothetical protein